jgi:hypothetical protein
VLLGVVLLVASGPWVATARAHVSIEIDPFHRAQHTRKPIVDQRVVTIAILGNDHFDPSTVQGKTLLFGPWYGVQVGSIRVAKRARDVNGDGFDDRLVKVPMSAPALDGFRTGRGQSGIGWLTGTLVDADGFVEPFRAGALVASTDDECGYQCVNGTTASGSNFLRCTWGPTIDPSSGPIECDTNLLEDVFPQAVGGQITDGSRMVIEASGGRGHDGSNATCGFDTASGGKGGAYGYAIYAETVSAALALADNGETIYYSVGGDASSHEAGGYATIVAGLPPDSQSTDVTPDSVRAFVAAAGGGGGGAGRATDDNQCRDGKDGGDGGAMSGADLSEADECGDDGIGKSGVPGGQGGNQMDGGGCGGGAGGKGSAGGFPGLSGIFAGGGPGDEHGGAGGFGYGGGGGGGRNDGHNLGGGGGGSWARASGFDPGDLAVGNAGSAQLVITFEVLPAS